MKQRAENRSSHARRRQDHASARRIRMAQALEAKHKQDGSDEICGFNKILGVGHFFSSAFTASFLRNILSMRSVMRKRPVTLIMAEVTAAQPRISARVWCWSYFDPA